MALSTQLKSGLNRALARFNLKIDSLTAEQGQARRIRTLRDAGHFDAPCFPVLPQFAACDPAPLLHALETYAGELAALAARPGEEGFRFDNEYFYSPDADAAYCIVRDLAPRRIIEVGSGNSTLLLRAAIGKNRRPCELISIDPSPRTVITQAADRVIADICEKVPAATFDTLEKDDILFIDSSHEVVAGNDVLRLMLDVMPRLRQGVVIHVHDIFLPYEYPEAWVQTFGWCEQYILQAALQGGAPYEVLWPGHYLQRTLPDFRAHFPRMSAAANATSLWLRKV